jgi:hypothetical protein
MNIRTPTKEEIQFARDYGWTDDQIEKGYEIFQCDGSESVIDGALIVEAIGVVNKFESDWDACRKAELDGVKFINDVDGLEKGCYVDTPENRQHCIEMIKKYPEYRVENLMAINESSNEYWDNYRKHFNMA